MTLKHDRTSGMNRCKFCMFENVLHDKNAETIWATAAYRKMILFNNLLAINSAIYISRTTDRLPAWTIQVHLLCSCRRYDICILHIPLYHWVSILYCRNSFWGKFLSYTHFIQLLSLFSILSNISPWFWTNKLCMLKKFTHFCTWHLPFSGWKLSLKQHMCITTYILQQFSPTNLGRLQIS